MCLFVFNVVECRYVFGFFNVGSCRHVFGLFSLVQSGIVKGMPGFECVGQESG